MIPTRARLFLARTAWCVVALGVIATTYPWIGMVFKYNATSPPGFTTSIDSLGRAIVAIRNSADAPAGMVTGDRLIAINGTVLSKGATKQPRGRIGDSILVTFQHGQEATRTSVMVYAPSAARALRRMHTSAGVMSAAFVVSATLVSLAVFGLALIIMWRNRRSAGHLMASATILLLAGFIPSLMFEAYVPWMKIPSTVVGLGAATAFFGGIYLFPNGRFTPRWTRYAFLASVSVVWVLVLGQNALPDWSSYLVFGSLVASMILIIVATVVRFRKHSTAVERLQTRWVVTALTTYLLATIALVIGYVFLWMHGDRDGIARINVIAPIVLVLCRAVLVAALWIAALRYRLWNLNTVLNRSTVYTLVTAVLAIIWAGSAVLLQVALQLFVGDTSKVLAAVVSSLQAAVLFQPVKKRVQAWVDVRLPRESAAVEAGLDALAGDIETVPDTRAIGPMISARSAELLQTTRVDVGWTEDGSIQPLADASDPAAPAHVVSIRRHPGSRTLGWISCYTRAEGREYDKPVRDALDRFAGRIAQPIATGIRERAALEHLDRSLAGLEARLIGPQVG